MRKTDVDPWGTATLPRSASTQVVFLGDAPRLVSTTRNISHKKIMSVLEGTELVSAGADRCVLRPRWLVRCACVRKADGRDGRKNSGTLHRTTAHIVSDFGGGWSSLVRSRIESWGAGRFEGNAETVSLYRLSSREVVLAGDCLIDMLFHFRAAAEKQARQGMSLILSLLRSARPLPNTSEEEEAEASAPVTEWEGRYSYKAKPSHSTGTGATTSRPSDRAGKQRARDDDDDEEDDDEAVAEKPRGAAPKSFFLSRHAGRDREHAERSGEQRTEGQARAADSSAWSEWWRGKG
jgi:hypothetical protein